MYRFPSKLCKANAYLLRRFAQPTSNSFGIEKKWRIFIGSIIECSSVHGRQRVFMSSQKVISTHLCPSAKIVNFPHLPPYQAKMFYLFFWSFLKFSRSPLCTLKEKSHNLTFKLKHFLSLFNAFFSFAKKVIMWQSTNK